MSGRIIVFKNTESQIKGDILVDDYKDQLRLDGIGFGTQSFPGMTEGSATVHQGEVLFSLPFGPWIAELQQRLYQGATLGDVEITEIEQKVDAANKKVFKKIRAIKLKDVWINELTHQWSGITSTTNASLFFDSMTFEAGDKVAYHSSIEAAAK